MRQVKIVKLWGTVKDKNDKALPYKSVSLLRRIKKYKKYYYVPVESSSTDKNGMYSFQIPIEDVCKYRVIVLETPR